MARKPKLGSLYPRGRILWIKYCKPGNPKPFRESSHSEDPAGTERLLKRRQGEIATGRFGALAVEQIRMDELFDDVFEDYELNDRNSIVQLKSRLAGHICARLSGRYAELTFPRTTSSDM